MEKSCVRMCEWCWKRAPVVLQLLQGEDVLVEVLLKFLIGVVDVELFEPIDLEAETPVSQTHAGSNLLKKKEKQNKNAPGKSPHSSDLKVLKAEDVQDPDGLKIFFSFDLLVDFQDDPGETLRVQRHGNRVSRIHGL